MMCRPHYDSAGTQPVVHGAQVNRMSKMQGYQRCATADNATIFHGREIRQVRMTFISQPETTHHLVLAACMRISFCRLTRFQLLQAAWGSCSTCPSQMASTPRVGLSRKSPNMTAGVTIRRVAGARPLSSTRKGFPILRQSSGLQRECLSAPPKAPPSHSKLT
jgi:hypothetical protein